MSSLSSSLKQAIDAMRHGQLADAQALCEQTLDREPKNVFALDIMAELAWRAGRGRDSVELAKRAVRIEPKDARLRINLGRALARVEQYRPAITQLDEALKLRPNHPVAVAEKAGVYEMQGRYDRIPRVITPLLADGATPPAVAALHTRWLIHEGRAGEAARFAEAVVKHGHDPSPGLRHTAFELVRAFERLERYDDAWRAAETANSIMSVPYDASGHARLVDRLVSTFPAGAMTPLVAGGETPRPIFVFGMPRTGTTLVERILGCHPDVTPAGENAVLHVLARTLGETLGTDLAYPEAASDLTADAATQIAKAYRDEMTRRGAKTTAVVDKSLENHLHVGLARRLFPDASFVHCRRDPLDTCVSCYLGRLPAAPHPYSVSLELLGRHYVIYDRLLAHWRATADDAWLDLDYETLVAEPEVTIRRIVEHCDLPWHDACLRPEDSKVTTRTLSFEQVREPIYRSSAGRATRYAAHLGPLRGALAGAAG